MAGRIPTIRPSLHEQIVQDLVDTIPRVKRRGLMAAIRREIPGVDTWGQPLGANPDAFQIDHENKCVVLYEVEVTHRVSDEKMRIYGGLWWGVDGMEWDLILVKVRPDGSVGMDVGDWVFENLADERDWGFLRVSRPYQSAKPG